MITASESDVTFSALFRAHYRILCRAIYRVTGDTALAEELASEAFWLLHQKPPVGAINLDGWLCRIGLRLALNAIRNNKTRLRYESLTPVPDAPANPEESLVREQERHRVRTVLGSIKRTHAELLAMWAGGLTYAELASVLHVSPASVGTLLARAEKGFRKEYEKRYAKR